MQIKGSKYGTKANHFRARYDHRCWLRRYDCPYLAMRAQYKYYFGNYEMKNKCTTIWFNECAKPLLSPAE